MNLMKIILLFFFGSCTTLSVFTQASLVGLEEEKIEVKKIEEGSEDLISSMLNNEIMAEPNYMNQGLVFSGFIPLRHSLWANIFYSISIFFIFYFIHLIRINQVRKYDVQRTKISSDLHKDVGSLLYSVAMQSEVLELSASDENKKLYNTFSFSIRDAMGKLRDTMWAIDSSRDSIESLVDRMEDHISDIVNAGLINVNFNHFYNRRSIDLQPDIRQNIYLIFKGALSNAIYSRDGDKVDIELSRHRKILRLTIHDNGKVDYNEVKASGVGLSEIKKRVRNINGQMSIDVSNGFRIEIIVG